MNNLIGYRIKILEENVEERFCVHFSGGAEATYCCPNCNRELFPVFTIDSNDIKVKSIIHWKEESLTIYFCPSCCFYMEDYWLEYKNNTLVGVYGGELDGGDVIQEIDFPFLKREVLLEMLTDGEEINSLPKHQIGGRPYLDVKYQMDCQGCRKSMPFLGVLAYDDLNIPLYENNGDPVALIIGDYDCMNIYSCVDCSILGSSRVDDGLLGHIWGQLVCADINGMPA